MMFAIATRDGSSATFSECMTYRYALGRRWADGPAVNFLMLNPSTADAVQDDPTIRRCIGYAKAWGYGSLVVTNLFALRATDPRELYKHPDPIGPDNNEVIVAQAQAAGLVVAAWGVHGAHLDRGKRLLAAIRKLGVVSHALRLTKGGHPRHPLYLPASLTPFPVSGEAA